VVSPQCPDMVIVKNTTTSPTVYLVELTCPFTRNIGAANRRKRERYLFLTTNIKDAGYQCISMPFEIGSRGHITRQNKINLAQLCNLTGVRKAQQVIKNCSNRVFTTREKVMIGQVSHWYTQNQFSRIGCLTIS